MAILCPFIWDTYDARMKEERDIDDILASLDDLLQENDMQSAAKTVKNAPVVRSAQSQHVTDTVKLGADEPSVKTKLLEKEEKVEPSVHVDSTSALQKTVLNAPRRVEIDVPDANFRLEPDVDTASTPATPLPRIVLTKEMLINTDQDDLPLDFNPLVEAMDDDDVEDDAEASPDLDEKEATTFKYENIDVRMSAKEVEQMLELVSMDISYQFHQLLPDMIRQSMRTHLNIIQDEQMKNKQDDEKK